MADLARARTSLRSIYERVSGGASMAMRGRERAVALGSAVRQSGESVVVSGALAAAHVHLPNGLDANVKGRSVPLDLGVAAVGILGGVALAGEEYATDLRNMGAAALSVFTFRAGYKMMAERKLKGGSVPGGQLAAGAKAAGEDDEDEDFGADGAEDPVVAVARALY